MFVVFCGMIIIGRIAFIEKLTRKKSFQFYIFPQLKAFAARTISQTKTVEAIAIPSQPIYTETSCVIKIIINALIYYYGISRVNQNLRHTGMKK